MTRRHTGVPRTEAWDKNKNNKIRKYRCDGKSNCAPVRVVKWKRSDIKLYTWFLLCFADVFVSPKRVVRIAFACVGLGMADLDSDGWARPARRHQCTGSWERCSDCQQKRISERCAIASQARHSVQVLGECASSH